MEISVCLSVVKIISEAMRVKKMALINPNLLRRTVLEMSERCGQPTHLGGSLSELDILNVLYGSVMRHKPAKPLDENRDIFILSKGHGFLGQLSVLYHQGYFSESDLMGFQSDGGEFISHPVRDLERGIESSNGSLGQGLSFGLGIALGSLAKGNPRRTFVLMGDSECSEGSVWEAAILAGRLRTSNLVAIVDSNGHGNDGYGPVLGRRDLANAFSAFGWSVKEVNGHDYEQLQAAFEHDLSNGLPTAVICETVKGKGVSFMEDNNDWHHGRVTYRVLEKALAELPVKLERNEG
jgi:transketolase